MRIRFILPLIFTILITQSDLWLPNLYRIFLPQEFSVLGTLAKFKTSCDTADCVPKYKIPIKLIQDSVVDESGLVTIGVGRFFGTMNWYCTQNGQRRKIYETGAHGRTSHSMDLFQYQMITIPIWVAAKIPCSTDLV